MELELYSTIEYTAGWYYKHYPGFYNIECYKILSDFSHNPEKYVGVEETKEHTEEDDEEEFVSRKKRNNGLSSEH